MTSAATYLLVYLVGGLTFLPVCIAIVLSYVVFTSKRKEIDVDFGVPDGGSFSGTACAQNHLTSPSREVHSNEDQCTEPNFAGYFAVCREYTPAIMNGKSLERSSSTRASSEPESLSVYQSMYRTIVNRNKSQGSSMGANTNTSRLKSSSNFFYVVLRHGRLILFDDSNEIEVRHVISLADRKVDIYAGDHFIPEGELWIKRNCIRLRPIKSDADLQSESQSFYFFSENSSAKEDFYFALLSNQDHHAGNRGLVPVEFDQSHMAKLVQQLHSSEDILQTRWANAIVGRLFLAMYRTSAVENFIRKKITKKIGRVAKPAFIQSISIRSIDMGDSAPLFKNPKLREMRLDGDLTAEADVTYSGNFRLEIMAVARIDLGARIKPRYVNMVLASILKKLEGHVLIRIKPPPSNRLWMTFEHPPKLEMAIEPIVSSRQITYGVILRAIENRIREVIAETLVMPNWDDLPFHDTCLEDARGGLWQTAERTYRGEQPTHSMSNPIGETSLNVQQETKKHPESNITSNEEKAMSMPNLAHALRKDGASQKMNRTISTISSRSESRIHGGTDPRSSSIKPKSMRSGSFSTIAQPVVNTTMATVESQQPLPNQTQAEAFSAVKDLSSLSQSTSTFASPVEWPTGSDSLPDFDEEDLLHAQPAPGAEIGMTATPTRFSASGSSTPSSFDSERMPSVRKSPFSEKRSMLNASFNSAATVAKKWMSGRQATLANTKLLPPDHGSSRESFVDQDSFDQNEVGDSMQAGKLDHSLATDSGRSRMKETEHFADDVDRASLSSSVEPDHQTLQSMMIKRKRVSSNSPSIEEKDGGG